MTRWRPVNCFGQCNRMISTRHLWLLLSLAGTAGSTVALLSVIQRMPHGSVPVWRELGAYLVLPFLLLLALPIARLARDAGPAAASKGDLDRLLRHKHQGLMVHGLQRIHDSVARRRKANSRRTPSSAGGT